MTTNLREDIILLENHAPVLALTIVDGNTLNSKNLIDENTSILMTVRDERTNVTHPNVVSVPTQRLSFALLEDILNSSSIKSHKGRTFHYESSAINNLKFNGHNSLIFAVESLLSRKLGVSSFLEEHSLNFHAAVRTLAIGTVRHPELIEGELTAMLNIFVVIENGAQLFPTSTASYSYITWCPIDKFLDTARSKDPLKLAEHLDPIQYCIHGLCIMSAFNFVAEELGHLPYPFDIYS